MGGNRWPALAQRADLRRYPFDRWEPLTVCGRLADFLRTGRRGQYNGGGAVLGEPGLLVLGAGLAEAPIPGAVQTVRWFADFLPTICGLIAKSARS